MNLALDDQCLVQFNNLKFRRTHIRYIIYKIYMESIAVQSVGQKQQNWNDFIDELPTDEYRFAVYDYQFKANDGRQISKLIFINWNPDSSHSFKGKVLYATAKQNFKKYLDLCGKDFTICSKDDEIIQEIIRELQK